MRSDKTTATSHKHVFSHCFYPVWKIYFVQRNIVYRSIDEVFSERFNENASQSNSSGVIQCKHSLRSRRSLTNLLTTEILEDSERYNDALRRTPSSATVKKSHRSCAEINYLEKLLR